MSDQDTSKEQLLTKLAKMRRRVAELEAAHDRHEGGWKRLHRGEAKFRAIFDRAGIGIALVDPQGRIVESNPAFQKMFGYSEEELRSLVFTDFTHPDNVPKDWQLAQELFAGKFDHYQLEKRYIRRDGQVVWGRLTVSLIQEPDAPPRFTVRMVENITRRKQAEAALLQYAADLEIRNQELDAYAHTVAHDLKNSLGLVIGYAQLLERDLAVLPEHERLQYIHLVAQYGRKMNNIVDELLLLAKLRQVDQAEMSPLNMAEITTEARGRLADLVEKHQAEIILPLQASWPTAWGYAPWVEEVWVNYLSNAIKYGGRPPRVELGATVQPDGQGRFWVRDNGPGLAREEQARLFTPFTQLHQVRAEGHGLGLSIVQRIVEKLGGQVGVESKGVPGQGSTFWFTLPGTPPA
jgi:PAS domain S-box-containing protein